MTGACIKDNVHSSYRTDIPDCRLSVCWTAGHLYARCVDQGHAGMIVHWTRTYRCWPWRKLIGPWASYRPCADADLFARASVQYPCGQPRAALFWRPVRLRLGAYFSRPVRVLAGSPE